MEHGIISLRKSYGFVKANHEIPRGDFAKWKEFRGVCDSLVRAVPEKQGFYLWGFYDQRGLWRNIYVGKAGFSKSGDLKARISEELRDERCFLWRTLRSEAGLLKSGRRLYPRQWKRYEAHWKRSLKKAGTSHIVWVATGLKPRAVKRVEADLIEVLNPRANVQRPAPPSTIQSDTSDILALMRQSIHRNRKGKYRLPSGFVPND